MDNTYNKYFDNSPYNMFALPSTCNHLQQHGLDSNVLFFYAVTDKYSSLICNFWDADNYYSDAQLGIIKGANAKIVPAYSVLELQSLLECPWIIEKMVDGNYQVCIDSTWNMNAVIASRLPDACALMLLQCIQKKVVDINVLNEKLKSLLPQAAVKG